MKTFLETLKEKVIIFDGAMGTSIQKKSNGQTADVCNEYLNIINPKLIQEIHADFLTAGAQVIETNTFGALPYLLEEYDLNGKAIEINYAAVHIALEVANDFSCSGSQRFVSGSIGPGTKLPTLGQIDYKTLYWNYYLQAFCLINEGVHLLQIETGQDPLQMKIALIAARDCFKELKKEVPIFLQATLQENGQMLVGTDLLTFINTFKDMPITALGINCGSGPQQIERYLRILDQHCPLYISILPNAGLPVLKDGEMGYDLSPKQFASICADLVKNHRINAIGGCCGTTADFIKELTNSVQATHSKHQTPNTKHKTQNLTSLFASQEIKTSPPPLIIGERANVNGSKKFKELLAENKWDEMVDVCLTQQEDGVHIVDINLSFLGRDETADMATFIPMINKAISVPIMIDSTNYNAIAEALKYCAGKPIVNSTNFENGEENAIKYIELCRDMNAALICLTIDEQGMATTFEHKIAIVNRFLTLCERLSFPQHLIFIDCLTFALTTGDEQYKNAGVDAIKTIKYLTENHHQINTLMGVSNVSFGLKPKLRRLLNSVFLSECVQNGLTAAIVDIAKILPINDLSPKEIKVCQNLIYNNNTDGDPLERLLALNVETQSTSTDTQTPTLHQSVVKGKTTDLQMLIDDLIKTHTPADIINSILLPAMQEVGTLFEKGKIAMPFVLKSAEVMKKAVDFLKPYMDGQTSGSEKSILLATVQGDVYDIGKNLVQIIIENNGYKVHDIGVKQTPEDIYKAICTHKPTALGLSALLIKSTGYMKETLRFLSEKGVDIPVICGGAALNKDFVEKELQSVYTANVVYGKDAFAGLKFMQQISE